MNISIRNNYSLGIIWKVIEITELLDLVTFALNIEQVAVSFFDRENWDLFDFFKKIGWLGDRNSSFVCIYSPRVVLGRNCIAKHF
jgi:hypothetical protein